MGDASVVWARVHQHARRYAAAAMAVIVVGALFAQSYADPSDELHGEN